MRARIHRGAHEVGGNCVELEAQGGRLILDLGRPLAAPPDADVPLPAVPGLQNGGDRSLVGLLLSHPHLDHYGLVGKIASDVPVFLGEAASRILQAAKWNQWPTFAGVPSAGRTLGARRHGS